jgi:hypothetical protein
MMNDAERRADHLADAERHRSSDRSRSASARRDLWQGRFDRMIERGRCECLPHGDQ